MPENYRWYDFYDLNEIEKNKINKKTEYNINNDKIGAFIKGGEIICKKMRIRRSIKKMNNLKQMKQKKKRKRKKVENLKKNFGKELRISD